MLIKFLFNTKFLNYEKYSTGLYGQWEGSGALPTLDACGGHVGNTPAATFYLNYFN